MWKRLEEPDKSQEGNSFFSPPSPTKPSRTSRILTVKERVRTSQEE
jgi:hypothetical protein